jgi:hypothetical protein
MQLFGQTTLDKIQSLNLGKEEGTILKYYSNGTEERANNLEELLGNSKSYFESSLGVKESFSIAVLDSNDWVKVTNIPYGLPFVSGPPYIVCFPSSNENVLGQIIQRSIKNYNLSEKYEKSDEELIEIFISMIGFHELGHIYAKEYGINFPNKWTYEFAATYTAYLYLTDNFPVEADIWLSISEILEKEINPNYTSLNDFENLYVRVGVENYAWYQVVFLLRVAEVEKAIGISLLEILLNTKITSSDEYLSLDKLENIHPGFLNWAEKYKLIEEIK